jgi:glutamate 5-kinase
VTRKKGTQRWVVKAGSNLIVRGGPLLIRSWMQQIATIRKSGIEVIWVSSGAVASGMQRTAFAKKKRNIVEKQALSAIGQPLLMDIYNIALQTSGQLGAQILLTYDDMSHHVARGHLRATLEQLLKWKVVPILNENDTTATEELRFGDNDALSAKVASMMNADRLVILTDVAGLYDSDPQKNPDARLIPHVKRVTESVLKMAPLGAGSKVGTGGMRSKLLAAQLANRSGVETWLAQGDVPNVLVNTALNKILGTRIG